MIEFVIVLLAKRQFEKRISPMENDKKIKANIIIGSKKTTVSKADANAEAGVLENVDVENSPHNRYLKKQVQRALFNSLFDPNDKPQDSGSKNRVEKGTSYRSNIDIASALLFPIMYALFNVIYWYCVM